MKQRRKKTGFTLIELLVTITIIGVLIALGLGSFVSAQKKARDARRKSDLQSISRALEQYYNDYNRYPDSGSNGEILGCGVSGTAACTTSFIAGTGSNAQYMLVLPTDPSGNYFYSKQPNGSYFIFARLENLDDKDVVKKDGVAAVYKAVTCRPTGAKRLCNYGISSSNNAIANITTIDAE